MSSTKFTASTEATKPNQPGLSAEKSITSNNTPIMENTMFPDEQITAQPKPTKPTAKQRKLDFADFKATFLAPAKLEKRHPLNIEVDIWEQLERVSRILGDRGTTVSSYANAILAEHLKQYADDIEIWRKL